VYLRNLSIVDFRNYVEAALQLSPQANFFTGLNGSGKTNLLDAVHYLCACKSAFNPIDSQSIRHEAGFFVIQGSFDKNGTVHEVYCGVKTGQKKVFKRNHKEYERLADHIGLFPVVIISPYDTDLIHEGSEERRKFTDSIISQFNRGYLEDLIRYNKALLQRNMLLRDFAVRRYFDEETLHIWDLQLAEPGNRIHEARKTFIEQFNPEFLKAYHAISQSREDVSLRYRSELHEATMEEILLRNRERDRHLQRSDGGIHKDDFVFGIGNYPLRKFGSQGQQKTFLIALKLAQFEFVREHCGIKPILLLDDIFDKIDETRLACLMELVSRHTFGQVFVSDTHEYRVPALFRNAGAEMKVFRVHQGTVEELETQPG